MRVCVCVCAYVCFCGWVGVRMVGTRLFWVVISGGGKYASTCFVHFTNPGALSIRQRDALRDAEHMILHAVLYIVQVTPLQRRMMFIIRKGWQVWGDVQEHPPDI